MDIVTTSLDALLQRATNPQNQNIDTAAVEAFCALINREKDGAHIGVKLIAARIHSQQEKEVIQTLHILDLAMAKCGPAFQGEVGKFRFLNEMIKLVSPKYLGSQTPISVKQKVLQLMYLWTIDYTKEPKIKEAFEMLKKQGVIREVPLSVSSENYANSENKMRTNSSIFQDEEKSKLLQKLLRSKNPEDLQAANRLIKSMVKEDDKRAELKSQRLSELESCHNNVRLLNEMLDSYRPNVSSQDELDLINELHQSCEKFRPGIMNLLTETRGNCDLRDDILQVCDELRVVSEKYNFAIIGGQNPQTKTFNEKKEKESNNNQMSLLDFGDEQEETNPTTATTNSDSNKPKLERIISSGSDIDVLNDIFDANKELPDTSILKPISISNITTNDLNGSTTNKMKAFEDLDALGEHLLKENLQSAGRIGTQFNKASDKIPMNKLTRNASNSNSNSNLKEVKNDVLNLDLSYLLEKSKLDDKDKDKGEVKGDVDDSSADDLLVDITTEKEEINRTKTDEIVMVENANNKFEIKAEEVINVQKQIPNLKKEVKLSDLFVNLESIKPSSLAPINALEEKNGISVTLHFAKDKPHEDVIVMVVTIVNKNENALKNILFRAIVPKSCKVKLQPASGTDLPPFNPFLPPSAITQIMLISNPEKVKVSLKFIVSYNIEDETTTEMGEIEELPLID